MAQHQVIPGATMNASALFGLPRFDHCALTYNNTLYIFGGRINNGTVTLQFSSSIASQPPIYRSIYTDNSWLWQDIMDGGGCAVTSYGQLIMLPPLKPCTVLDLDTLQPISTRISGSPVALDSFGNNNGIINSSIIESPPRPRRQMASTMWNDLLVVFGGLVSDNTTTNWTLSQSTFILDARIQSQWLWYEAPIVLGNTPPAGTNAVMVSTQRWILLFSIVPAYNSSQQDISSSSTQYNVSVYCFDPYVYMWTGKVVEFISQTDTIKAESMATANNTDSVLVVPGYSSNNNNASNVPISLSRIALLQSYGLWRLEMSVYEAKGTIHWIPPSRLGPFRPLVGGSVTKVSSDLIVLYGGVPFSHDSFRFWNASLLSFLDARWWNEIQWHPNRTTPSSSSTNDNQGVSNRKLAIILGTVLGFVALVMIILVCYWCCYRRGRRDQQNAAHNDAPRSPMAEDQNSTQLPNRHLTVTPDQLATAWGTQLKRALSNVGRQSSFTKQRRHSSLQPAPATLPSSSQPSSPPFPIHDDNDEVDNERQRQIREASRFNEHFDLMAPTDTNMLDRVSEEEQADSNSDDPGVSRNERTT
ncbi:hypothetical protein K492DRAFT_208349 [Lichtheimia hyalospora FSU 10163]|nr:hypothetical protein K492DRAFT_208349 [Lichtheimia hyalospora FSU 10163]